MLTCLFCFDSEWTKKKKIWSVFGHDSVRLRQRWQEHDQWCWKTGRQFTCSFGGQPKWRSYSPLQVATRSWQGRHQSNVWNDWNLLYIIIILWTGIPPEYCVKICEIINVSPCSQMTRRSLLNIFSDVCSMSALTKQNWDEHFKLLSGFFTVLMVCSTKEFSNILLVFNTFSSGASQTVKTWLFNQFWRSSRW